MEPKFEIVTFNEVKTIALLLNWESCICTGFCYHLYMDKQRETIVEEEGGSAAIHSSYREHTPLTREMFNKLLEENPYGNE